MTDAMFTFAWYALALGTAAGRFPKPGELSLVGGSPRYQLYATKDGKLVACGAIEQKFWESFSAAIGLPAELIDDERNPKATQEAVAKLIAARTAEEWRPVLAQRRLLRHHRHAAAAGDARSAFRRARAVRASRSKPLRARRYRRCRCRSRRSSARARAKKAPKLDE